MTGNRLKVYGLAVAVTVASVLAVASVGLR